MPMLEQLLGSSLLVSALVALVHAVRLALPEFAKALTARHTARATDAATKAATETARSSAEADIRLRLDHCEESHKARDAAETLREERARRRELDSAREMGMLRGQLAALRDQFQALPKAGPASGPEGHV